MSLTFGQARQLLAQYAAKGGRCPDEDGVALFVIKVLQHLLYKGEHGSLRKFCFYAVKGCFTVPYELDVPLKIKVDDCVGTVWDKFFEWFPPGDIPNCVPAANALTEDPNYYATVFDLPSTGARVGALGICDEADDAHLIVKGIDPSGREIFTFHNGEQISGEYLRIQKGTLRYTTVPFAKITDVVKSKTNGYVQLLAVRPDINWKAFLADYTPLETAPKFRRFKLSMRCADSAKVSVLGRIRLKTAYADNDYIPFDNIYALDLAGQEINANYNNDLPAAKSKSDTLREVIDNENSFKRVQTGIPMEFFQATSSGAIKNIQ